MTLILVNPQSQGFTHVWKTYLSFFTGFFLVCFTFNIWKSKYFPTHENSFKRTLYRWMFAKVTQEIVTNRKVNQSGRWGGLWLRNSLVQKRAVHPSQPPPVTFPSYHVPNVNFDQTNTKSYIHVLDLESAKRFVDLNFHTFNVKDALFAFQKCWKEISFELLIAPRRKVSKYYKVQNIHEWWSHHIHWANTYTGWFFSLVPP